MSTPLAEFLEQLWERSTPGHWMVYSSNSWRRIGLKGGGYKEIIWPCTHVSDGHVDLCGPNRDHDLALLMELRNHVPEILQALRATAPETRDGILDTYIDRHDRDTAKIKAMRDKLAELCDRLDWKGPARESNLAITVKEARAMIEQHDRIAAGVNFIVNGLLGDD